MIRTVTYYSDGETFGGVEQALLYLVEGLDRSRWHPVLMHPSGAPVTLLERARELDVELRPVPDMSLGLSGARRLPSFIHQLRGLRPSVFHAHRNWELSCKWALFGAIIARVPAIIVTTHAFLDLPAYGAATRLQQHLITRGIDQHIAVSEGLASKLHRAFNISEAKIRTIRNGIPASSFASERCTALRVSVVGADSRPVVLTVARLDEQKGVGFLLEAAKLVPEAVFVIVGEGPDRGVLERYVSENGLRERVRFLGHRDDVPDLLAMSDCFVLPSRWDEGGLPLTILEAMASGRPVVASRVRGIDEAILHGDHGLLVPPEDPPALANAIRTILCDQDLRQRFAAAGRDRVLENFTTSVMSDRVSEVYEQVLLQSGTAS